VCTRPKTTDPRHGERRKAREFARDLERLLVFYTLVRSMLHLKSDAVWFPPNAHFANLGG
jgi:hypothetical protein